VARVLVVDDEPLVRATFRALVEDAGYEVDEAGDGREGAAKFEADPPDLALIDLVMPVRDGIEMISDVRRRNPDVPIIAVSGGGTVGSLLLSMAEKLGADRTLTKPVSGVELLTAIGGCLAHRP